MNRAYSLISIRGLDDEQRIIEGTASHISVDKVGDIVEPRGMRTRPGGISLLWQHRHDSPVGRVESIQPTATSVPFRARIEKSDRPGVVKDLLDQAWDSVRLKLVRAVSIGFTPIKWEPIATGYRYLEWWLEELSLVTIPAQQEATIQTVKRLDRAALAANGPTRVVRLGHRVGDRKYHPVVRIGSLAANEASQPVAAAIRAQLDRHQAIIEQAENHGKLGGANSVLLDAVAAGTRATDAALAELRQRLARLEGRA